MGEWDKELGWEDSDRLLIAVLYCCERHQLDLGDRKKELSEMFQRRCWLSILTWGLMRMIEFMIKQTTSREEEHIITNTSHSPWWKHRESKDENWHLHGSAVVAAESGMEYWEKERTKQKKVVCVEKIVAKWREGECVYATEGERDPRLGLSPSTGDLPWLLFLCIPHLSRY